MLDKSVLVTGAGSGVGREAAIQLSQAGYNVALVGRTRSKLEATAQQLDGPHLILDVDLEDAQATTALVQRTVSHFGRLDALANCAGCATLAPIEKTTPQLWRQVIDANLSYVVHLTASAWPIFARQNNGVIVNVSSMSSIDPFPGLTLYAAAKVGLNMFTACTAREGEAVGIRAVALVLGAVETPMLRSMFDEKQLPSSATMSPRYVGQVVCDCITGARTFVSGEAVRVLSEPSDG